MFTVLENWYQSAKFKFILIYLVETLKNLNFCIKQRNRQKVKWNLKLPRFYKTFKYKKAIEVNTSGLTMEKTLGNIINIYRRGIK